MMPPALSTGTGGSGVTSEPVAKMMFLASYDDEAPSAPATLTCASRHKNEATKEIWSRLTYKCTHQRIGMYFSDLK